MCVCVCSQPAPTAVGEEETTVSVSNVVSPSLLLLLPFPPSLLPHSHAPFPSLPRPSGSVLPSSLAIILLGYAMHSPPTVTNWCWRPTVTLLSPAVGADPYCHSDCLALWLPLPPLQTSAPWDFTAFPPILEYHLPDSTNSGTCLIFLTSAQAG